MRHACATVVNWSPVEVRRAFEDRRAPERRDNRWPRKVSFPDEPVDPRIFLLGPYGAMLKLMELESQRATWRSKGGEFALEKFVDWMNDDLGVRQTYPMNLAGALLVGTGESNNSARRVLKISGSEGPDDLARSAWNAAWDILMTSLGEGMTYGLAPVRAGVLHKLVTRNVDPVNLRREIETRAIIDTGSSKIPFATSSFEISRRSSVDRVSGIMDMDPMEAYRRQGRSPESMIKQAASAVSELEASLGVTARISFDGWSLS